MRICKKKTTKEDIWTKEEDEKLVDAYRFGGPFNWKRVSELTGRDVFNCVKRFSILCPKRKDGRALLSTSYAPPPPTELPTGLPSPSTTLRFLSTCLPPPKNENLKRKLIYLPPPVPPQKSCAREEVAWKWRKTCLPPPVLPQKNYAREEVVWKWRKT